MNKIFRFFTITFLVTAIMSGAFAQDKISYSSSYDLIVKAYEYKEQGNYEEAVKYFEQVYEGDSLFFDYALHERMACYHALEQDAKAKELGDKYWYFRHKQPTEFYLIYGTVLDYLKEYDKAQLMYKSILEEYPMNYSLWYNYGISLLLSGKHEEAYNAFKTTVQVNPFYEKAHYYLGLYATYEKQTSKAIMAFAMYMILSTNNGNNFSQLGYVDYIAKSKYWQDEGFSGSNNLKLDGNDGFGTIDQLVHNYIATTDKYKTKSQVKYPFVKQSHLVFSQLEDLKIDEDNFWNKYYVTFFRKMMEDNQYPGYTYYISTYIENEDISKIVIKNKKTAVAFYNWAMQTLTEMHNKADIDFFEVKNANVYRDPDYHSVFLIGDFDFDYENTKAVGDVEIYNLSGRKSGEGKLNENGLREGKWSEYFPSGYLKEKAIYKNGEYIDSTFAYFDNGLLKYALYVNPDGKTGVWKSYQNGVLYSSVEFKNMNIRHGLFQEFHPGGDLKSEYHFIDGLSEGEYKNWYDSGELESVGTYKADKPEGEEMSYYRNGQIMYKMNYKDGLAEGEYISYFENGNINTKGSFIKGKKTGEWISFYESGNKNDVVNFDLDGKENGIYEQFTEDGRKLADYVYTKGEISEYRFYDKNGEVLSEGKRKAGDFYYKSFYENGNIDKEGKFGKKDKNGLWKSYDINGSLVSEEQYLNGVNVDTFKRYFRSGELETIYKFNKEGGIDGYYADYFRNGNLYCQGYFNNGESDGPWVYYYPDKTVNTEMFLHNGLKEGFETSYTVAGLPYQSGFYEDDLLMFTIYYDTAGLALDTVFETPGKRSLELRYCKTCGVYMTVDVYNNNYNGNQVFYYPDGTISSKGLFFNGNRNGKWESYYEDGVAASTGSYKYGEKNGEWITYYKNGKISNKTNYEDGEENGESIDYEEDGSIAVIGNFKKGEKDGEFSYFIGGKLDHKRIYKNDQWISYSYTKGGKTIIIELTNETADIEIYWNNGQLARKMSVKNGWFQGPYNCYYENGNPESELFYVNNWSEGEQKRYYPNRQLRSVGNYENDNLEGIYKEYYQNGILKEESNCKNGEYHGNFYNYDEDGNLIKTLVFNNGQIVDVK